MIMEAINVGLSLFSSLGAGAAEEANIRAKNTVNSATTIANNLMRGANNELLSKRNALARYVQNENNKRTMTQTGREQEASLINYRRGRDAAASGDFEAQIGFSEQAGAQAAMAGFSGLTGGITDIVASTTALRTSRVKQASLQSLGQADWDAAQRQRDIMAAGLNSLDQSYITDDIDYSLDTHVDQRRGGNAFSDILKGVAPHLETLAGAASSFFNTPSYSAFADRAGAIGSGSASGSGVGPGAVSWQANRTITGGR